MLGTPLTFDYGAGANATTGIAGLAGVITVAVAVAVVLGATGSAQAESSVLLEAPANLAGIMAITFDDSGSAVGDSSFSLELLENGNQKMTVRMAIEGGGQSISEALFAPVPRAIPSIGPAESRPSSVSPQGSSPSSSGLPPISSPPPSDKAIDVIDIDIDSNSDAVSDAVAHIAHTPIAGLRLIEQRSQSTRADGTLLELLIIDHVAGQISCTPDGAAPGQSQHLALPPKDRVVNVPMQLFFLPLVRDEVEEINFQIAMCKDGPTLYEMVAVRGPRKNLGDREVLEVRYGPDFGEAITFFASRLMPTFSFWFDVKTGEYLGHRMPLHRGGPEVTLVRSGISPPAIGLSW